MRLLIPDYAKEAAREALEIRRTLPKSKQFGLTKSEAQSMGINSGVERARQIIRNKYLEFDDVKDVARFYLRFRNCRTFNCEGSLGLWGGRRFGRLCVSHVRRFKQK